MTSFSLWLKNHKCELSTHKSGCEICKIRYNDHGCSYLLKVLDVSELDPKVVLYVVSLMNNINIQNLYGLMKYQIIEINENVFYRMMREYKVHLDEINPLKYFKESGVFGILNEIIQALQSLYKNRTIHSDLKPSNIFLNDKNEVVLSDYLNSLLYKGKENKRITGKMEDLCFVCIDELVGKELDIWSDIWNFGLIFYYIISGKYPFVGLNMLETMKNIENINFVQLNCKYNNEFNTLLKRILVKEKRNRSTFARIIYELNSIFNQIELGEGKVTVISYEVDEMKIYEELSKINKKNSLDNYVCNNYFCLDYGGYNMRDGGIKYLCKELDKFYLNVNEINMMFNSITSAGLYIFSQSLKCFAMTEKLWLSNNPIGGSNTRFFANNLHFLPRLKKLGLTKCELDDDDIKYISAHFKDISNLEALWVDNNKIGDIGVKCLCGYIGAIPKLKELYLNENRISDIGGEILIDKLNKCKELEVLWIEYNHILNYDDIKRKIKEKHPSYSLFKKYFHPNEILKVF